MTAFQLASVLCVLLVSSLAEHHGDHSKSGYGGKSGHGSGGHAEHEKQIEELEGRVLRLGGMITEMQDYWDNTIVPEREKFRSNTNHLMAVVSELKPSNCEDTEFQCGGLEPQCINALHVCDGTTDCHNGNDEEADLCVLRAPVGTVLEAHLGGSDDCTKRKPTLFRVTITGAKQHTWFQSRLKVTADVYLEFDTDDAHSSATLSTKGYYNFARREIVLQPPEDDRLGFTCKFDGYHENHCHGEIVHEATLDTCLKFPLYKKH